MDKEQAIQYKPESKPMFLMTKLILLIFDVLGILATSAFWTGFWKDEDKIEGHLVTWLTIISLSLTIIYKIKNRKK